MDYNQTLSTIEKRRVIAILRGDFRGRDVEIASALIDGGITAVEVTLNSPGACDSIARLAARFGSRIAVGAGTVLKREEVELVKDAGAWFIVSPNCEPAVIEAARRLEMVSLPGCFTPTEIVRALDCGADAVKLFPAQCLGVEFVRAMSGPFRGIRLVPTGGISPGIAREYFSAGAWAVGVGSELVGKQIATDSEIEQIRKRALAFTQAAGGGSEQLP